jgi:hypothetical protein
MYAAWWLFLIGQFDVLFMVPCIKCIIIALTVTGGLGMAGSGNDDLSKRPSQSEWLARRWTLLGIIVCALCVVGGFIAFCQSFQNSSGPKSMLLISFPAIAVIGYDLTGELQTGKGTITG